MSDDRKDKKQWVDAVARLIELTQRGRIRWSSVEPKGTVTEVEDRTSGVFQAVHNGKILRLYGKRVTERRAVPTEDFTRLLYPPKYELVKGSKVVLEFVDARGATLWTFPELSALRDLLTAAQYQVAEVGSFLDELFKEPEAIAS